MLQIQRIETIHNTSNKHTTIMGVSSKNTDIAFVTITVLLYTLPKHEYITMEEKKKKFIVKIN